MAGRACMRVRAGHAVHGEHGFTGLFPRAGIAAAENQTAMARQGGLEMLITLLGTTNEPTQRQAAKALANLGVNGEAQPLSVQLCPRDVIV